PVRESPDQIGRDEAKNAEGEQADDQERPFRKIKEAEEQSDEQPWQERRGDAAVEIGAEQRGEGEQLDGNQRRQLEITALPVDEWKGPEQPDAGDHGPAREARMRVAQIEEHADRLGQRGPEQMREYEVLRQATLGALELGLGRDEPIDEPDGSIPEQ